MQLIRPFALFALAAAIQSPALAAGGDMGNYAPATVPTPASVPELPGYQLPRETPMPDADKLLGAPREVGASEPDDDTKQDPNRRAKPIFDTTTPAAHGHSVFANPWPPAWSSTSGPPAYRNPW
jgi:hypothetical protein